MTILDRDPEVLEKLGIHFESRAKTRFSNRANLAASVAEAVGGLRYLNGYPEQPPPRTPRRSPPETSS